jgi:hypothetical protein
VAVGDRWARRNVGFVEELGARPEHGGSTAEVAGQPVGPGGAEDGVRVAYPALRAFLGVMPRVFLPLCGALASAVPRSPKRQVLLHISWRLWVKAQNGDSRRPEPTPG